MIVADINAERLALASKLGADVTIDCSKEELRAVVMNLTGGDGVERLVEASGASAMVNACFSLLRKVVNNCLKCLFQGAKVRRATARMNENN